MIYFTVFQSPIIFKVIYPTLPLANVTGLKKTFNSSLSFGQSARPHFARLEPLLACLSQ